MLEGGRLERGGWGLPTPLPRSKAKQRGRSAFPLTVLKKRERERERENWLKTKNTKKASNNTLVLGRRHPEARIPVKATIKVILSLFAYAIYVVRILAAR